MARILRLEPQRITRRSLEIISDGKPRYLEEVGSPVMGQDGRVIGRLLTLRDVTEEHLLAAYRNEISSMVVHDLRGPLGSIITSHDMMQDIAKEMGNDELPLILNVSLESANAMMNLVDSLMDIAKLETRRMPLKRASTDIKTLIDSAVIALSGIAAQAQINVEHTIPADLPPVNVDGDKIRRVMINVIDNAIRYTPMHGKVHIAAKQRRNKIVIHVSDSGPGIPQDEIERVFEKFRQSTKNIPLRGSKGSGLGLTFCKLTLEAHGETIWAGQSPDLPGARFSFTLPIAIETASVGS
jgi:signal transduction histidine kinase